MRTHEDSSRHAISSATDHSHSRGVCFHHRWFVTGSGIRWHHGGSALLRRCSRPNGTRRAEGSRRSIDGDREVGQALSRRVQRGHGATARASRTNRVGSDVDDLLGQVSGSSRTPDRRNLDSALLSCGRGATAARRARLWGKKARSLNPFTGGFSCGFQRPRARPRRAVGTSLGDGRVPCRPLYQEPTRLNNRRFLRSFLRHFQQPGEAPPPAALHAPNLGTIRLPLRAGL
jgi:hypothetical protein